MKNLGKECGCYMHFPITYAGFFAPSDNLFFLLLSFLFCPPLKNDGRGELRFGVGLNTCLSFLNEVKNLAKDTGITYSDLCTHPCPYRLAGSALPSAFGGS